MTAHFFDHHRCFSRSASLTTAVVPRHFGPQWHLRAPATERTTRSGGRVTVRLVFHFGVKLRPGKDHDRQSYIQVMNQALGCHERSVHASENKINRPRGRPHAGGDRRALL
jgi:hypothetical protein